jgi:hypothetical protein
MTPVCVDAGGFFNLPHPIQALRDLHDPGLSSPYLLLPLNVRFFAGASSQVLSVEWPATALALRLTPPPGMIAGGRFAPPFLARRRPRVAILLLNLLISELFGLADSAHRAGQPGSLP